MPVLAAVQPVSWPAISVLAAPVGVVLWILWRWSVEPRTALYALGRMLLQLMLIGYVLTGVFESESPWVVALVLTVMLGVAAWIAIRTAPVRDATHYRKSLLAIASGGGATLLLVTQGVLDLNPWFEPRFVVPLAGMILATAMNAVSLAAERFSAEQSTGAGFVVARHAALRAAMIPNVNALLAVGLVSIPGMMTGQVLAGVDPLVAARYQIMVMAMVFSSAGLSAAGYLALMAPGGSGAGGEPPAEPS